MLTKISSNRRPTTDNIKMATFNIKNLTTQTKLQTGFNLIYPITPKRKSFIMNISLHNIFKIILSLFLCCGLFLAQPSQAASPEKSTATEKQNKKINALFFINALSGTVEQTGNKTQIVIPANSSIILFSDRPNRIAKPVKSGLIGFVEFFKASNFVKNPPNITFSAELNAAPSITASVLEIGTPTIEKNNFILPIIKANGSEKIPNLGKYKNITLVIDNILWDIAEDVGAIGGVGLACLSVPLTLGASGVACGSAVVGTAGLVGNQVSN